jgi:hypothetical protein
VLVNAVRTTQAAGYTMTVGGSVDVQGQGFPIRGRGQGGHIEVEVAGRRKVLDVSPARLLAYARSVKSAGQLGTETVDGVMTTHYDAEVRTPANLVRQAGDTIPVEVWVDASDRIRRVRARVTTPDFEAVPQVDLRAAPRAPRP